MAEVAEVAQLTAYDSAAHVYFLMGLNLIKVVLKTYPCFLFVVSCCFVFASFFLQAEYQVWYYYIVTYHDKVTYSQKWFSCSSKVRISVLFEVGNSSYGLLSIFFMCGFCTLCPSPRGIDSRFCSTD